MTATGLGEGRVILAAAVLRGPADTPDLLCCGDGDPWALTLDGRRLLEAL